jgi:hypothetical protein
VLQCDVLAEPVELNAAATAPHKQVKPSEGHSEGQQQGLLLVAATAEHCVVVLVLFGKDTGTFSTRHQLD